MNRSQKIAFLNAYASGKKQPLEPDYSNLSDDELYWIVEMGEKSEGGLEFSAAELQEIDRLNKLAFPNK